MNTPPSAQQQQTGSPLPEQRPLRILMVEDNRINQKVMLHLLKRVGYQTDVADSGLAALEALERQPYDVVLMDLYMPEMDGLETTRLIRRRLPETRQPCIIAMTASEWQDERDQCLEAGMDDYYIGKPAQKEILADVLKQCRPLSG
jgi:CheY-like chemotaxis protein